MIFFLIISMIIINVDAMDTIKVSNALSTAQSTYVCNPPTLFECCSLAIANRDTMDLVCELSPFRHKVPREVGLKVLKFIGTDIQSKYSIPVNRNKLIGNIFRWVKVEGYNSMLEFLMAIPSDKEYFTLLHDMHYQAPLSAVKVSYERGITAECYVHTTLFCDPVLERLTVPKIVSNYRSLNIPVDLNKKIENKTPLINKVLLQEKEKLYITHTTIGLLKDLLSCNVLANVCDSDGLTPLDIVCDFPGKRSSVYTKKFEKQSMRVILSTMLLQAGARQETMKYPERLNNYLPLINKKLCLREQP